ncbi:hypothetical protein [Raoultella ornithinolytica]|uniref:hypothetical protein n=1 Tax=Raoultella ornithinolytica TaxID=54291 RepID=UPI002287F394|nr:hypothetical protein [Raoultella ornithinolytica]
MKFDFEQMKHTVELVIEKNQERVNRLLQADYLDSQYFFDDYEQVMESINNIKSVNSDFMAWLIVEDANLYASLIQMIATAMAIDNTISQISVSETGEFLA